MKWKALFRVFLLSGLCLSSNPSAMAQHQIQSYEQAMAIPRESGTPWNQLLLKDEKGRDFQFSSLAGKLILIDFFFTRCPTVCPPQTASLHQLLQKLRPQTRAKINFVSVTIDPANDKEADLKAYRQRFRIKADAPWTFVRGEVESVKTIGRYFGGLNDKNPLDHRAQIYLIGPKGESMLTYTTVPRIDIERVARDIEASVEVFQKASAQN